MGIFINETTVDVLARVTNCNYVNNYASDFAGGVYIFSAGHGSHNVSIKDCTFHHNKAVRGAGGLIHVGTNGTISRPHTFYVTRCHFESNSAGVGGAVFFSSELSEGRSNVAHISQCKFIGNILTDEHGFGAALAVLNGENYSDRKMFPTHTLTDW